MVDIKTLVYIKLNPFQYSSYLSKINFLKCKLICEKRKIEIDYFLKFDVDFFLKQMGQIENNNCYKSSLNINVINSDIIMVKNRRD